MGGCVSLISGVYVSHCLSAELARPFLGKLLQLFVSTLGLCTGIINPLCITFNILEWAGGTGRSFDAGYESAARSWVAFQ